MNQTLDLSDHKQLQRLVAHVYARIDCVTLREPLSLQAAQHLELSQAKLIPDAVYALPSLKSSNSKPKGLPETRYIALTGSSALRRNTKGVKWLLDLTFELQARLPEHSLVFLSNAKTDLYLAKEVAKTLPLQIISSDEVGFSDCMRIIQRADLLIGGCQHPSIFAYICKTPYIAYAGNTFKNSGVALLQNYAVPVQKLNAHPDQVALLALTLIDQPIENWKDLSFTAFNPFKAQE